jgi:hypothetical protein
MFAFESRNAEWNAAEGSTSELEISKEVTVVKV